MFERREQRVFQVSMEKVFPYVCDYWRVQGFNISQPSPYYLHCEHYRSTLGLRRVCDIYLREHQGYTYIDVIFRAQITDEGAVAGAAAAIIFFPAAVVGGAISYSEYEDDANRMIWGLWNYINTIVPSLNANTGAAPPSYVYSRFSEPPATPQTPQPHTGQGSSPGELSQSPPSVNQVHTPHKQACSNCNTVLEPEWKVCPKCGKKCAD